MISMCVCVCEPKWLFYFVSFFFLSLMMIQLKRCINEFNDIMIIEMNVYKIHKYYLHTSRTMMKKEKKSPTGSWKTISINNNFEPFFFWLPWIIELYQTWQQQRWWWWWFWPSYHHHRHTNKLVNVEFFVFFCPNLTFRLDFAKKTPFKKL